MIASSSSSSSSFLPFSEYTPWGLQVKARYQVKPDFWLNHHAYCQRPFMCHISYRETKVGSNQRKLGTARWRGKEAKTATKERKTERVGAVGLISRYFSIGVSGTGTPCVEQSFPKMKNKEKTSPIGTSFWKLRLLHCPRNTQVKGIRCISLKKTRPTHHSYSLLGFENVPW